jgi:hypothetical protein
MTGAVINGWHVFVGWSVGNDDEILTSLDPFFHHGSHFMPATTRFPDGFLPWMR